MINYNIEVLKITILSISILASVFVDIKKRKIPNYITLPTILIGIGLNTAGYGLQGAKNSLEGIIFAFGIFIIPYILGIIGGGDLKLIIAIGAMQGKDFLLISSMVIIICGGIIAFILMVRNKNIKMSDIFAKLKHFIFQKKVIKANSKENYFPYSIAIALGVAIALML